MKKLTKEDVKKISLYIPFQVRFEPISCTSLFSCQIAAGIIGSMVVYRYDDEFGIEDTSDILHPKNNNRPILRLLETMTDGELDDFEKLTRLHNVSKEEMIDEIIDYGTPKTLFYALSKHFDLFDLIKSKKAIQLEASHWGKKMIK